MPTRAVPAGAASASAGSRTAVPPPTENLRIGERLRAARERLGLTLEQLADQCDLSKAHLSRLESGDRQPSVSTLLLLSGALGARVSALLGEDPGGAPLAIHSSEDPRHDAGGLLVASCSGYADSRAIEALRITVHTNRPASTPARHRGEEWLYVLSGTLELEYDGQLYVLSEGMSAHFDADRPHRMTAPDSAAEVLLVAADQSTDLRAIHR
jgi:transcriptional regulator with XRE-family HTH domain